MNDTTQLEKVRAEMVRRHENDLERAAQCIAELEKQLATEREAKMHETERAQTLMQERNKWKAFESSTAKILEHTRKERDAARQSRKRLVEFVRYRARELENADEFIRDIEAERDTARENARALRQYVAHTEGCASWNSEPMRCNCGLLDALQRGAKYLKDGEQT